MTHEEKKEAFEADGRALAEMWREVISDMRNVSEETERGLRRHVALSRIVSAYNEWCRRARWYGVLIPEYLEYNEILDKYRR